MSVSVVKKQSENILPETHSKLSAQDLRRVDHYLSSPTHQIKRKPFKPWLMLLLLGLTVLTLGGMSILVSKLALGFA